MVFSKSQQFDLVEPKQSMGYTGEYEGGGTIVKKETDSPPPSYGEVVIQSSSEFDPVLESSTPKGKQVILYLILLEM